MPTAYLCEPCQVRWTGANICWVCGEPGRSLYNGPAPAAPAPDVPPDDWAE